MAFAEGTRPARVAERIRAELMDLIIRGAIRDPGAEGVVISSVKVTSDLGVAHVYVRHLDEVGEARRDQMVAGMERASGYLRRELGSCLGLRYVPRLAFHWDDTVDSALRIEQIFEEIEQESSSEGET